MFQTEYFVCKTDDCNNRKINRKDCKDYPNGGSDKSKVFKSRAFVFWILFRTAGFTFDDMYWNV